MCIFIALLYPKLVCFIIRATFLHMETVTRAAHIHNCRILPLLKCKNCYKTHLNKTCIKINDTLVFLTLKSKFIKQSTTHSRVLVLFHTILVQL